MHTELLQCLCTECSAVVLSSPLRGAELTEKFQRMVSAPIQCPHSHCVPNVHVLRSLLALILHASMLSFTSRLGEWQADQCLGSFKLTDAIKNSRRLSKLRPCLSCASSLRSLHALRVIFCGAYSFVGMIDEGLMVAMLGRDFCKRYFVLCAGRSDPRSNSRKSAF